MNLILDINANVKIKQRCYAVIHLKSFTQSTSFVFKNSTKWYLCFKNSTAFPRGEEEEEKGWDGLDSSWVRSSQRGQSDQIGLRKELQVTRNPPPR